MYLNPTKVLVIGNHSMMRAAIVNAIADEPDLSIVAVTAGGSDTLQIIENLQPEIILFSIGKPDGEELDLMQKMHGLSPSSSVLALTSPEWTGQEKNILAHGAHATLVKTAPRTELLHMIRKLKAVMNDSEKGHSGTSSRVSHKKKMEAKL